MVDSNRDELIVCEDEDVHIDGDISRQMANGKREENKQQGKLVESSKYRNMLIITLVWTQSKLKTPMYFFLCNLSFLEICYTSVTLPKMLDDLLHMHQRIFVIGCIAQCYFFFVLGAIENYILAVMAYDRYLAICNPLRYSSIMSHVRCWHLALACWFCSILSSFLPLYWLCHLSFCGPNQINHFFCDVIPLLNISCTDVSMLKTYFFVFLWIIVFGCLLFIIVSYWKIILTIFRIPSGKYKAFSTCVSHFTVVLIYYGSVILIYVRSPNEQAFEYDKSVSVLYVVVTPLLNPIIYSLRNKELRKSMNLIQINFFGNIRGGILKII
ncbi:olfactory receptor 6F1-like [Pseudophryne corroboree]|uniref:olfactory receptor 6F1-like n=1 Tax=Pseudophryne corroboree TaxID=495146 RepID=UPI003081BA1E